MAFSEFELRLIDSTVGDLCRRNSPARVADQLRTVYDIEGHAVTIFEERPDWMDSSLPWMRNPVARLRFYRSRGEWVLYWMPSDLKWHAYEPADDISDIRKLVAIVEQDAHCAFFG
ncbi:MAG: DUF3024 domain-containing protein [Actinomycetota bacterium]|nr:DUF3024 domain-containing protein [Actinomycetota bacterium]